MSVGYAAFQELFPDRKIPSIKISYSGHFKPYNANVSFTRNMETLHFKLSNNWTLIDDEIQKGLLQHLLLRIFKEKKHTFNIELYHHFTKNLDRTSKTNNRDQILENHFNELNEIYFSNTMETPNLIWGKQSRRTLGTYNFHTDTITISEVLRNAPIEILKYVIYHEMVHKWTKFETKFGRTRSHTSEFRNKEREFANFEEIEKSISIYLRGYIM